ncbi:CD225/dispanin family protein [Nocardiopsis algeriensis]|uniref:Interferon-induced transmembrane protein n=1 Tax=Nocardiopsis algeriensis TaxID=1478215 RepID=A0A841IY41_9ACTN|nr:CD225/dispanin family protein [Nocardiopsis algeriensis]MBB6121395.1 hypothetical protein [Nocardiopsis algeriensis]
MSYPPPPSGYGIPHGHGGPPPGEMPKTYLVHNILGILSCAAVAGIIGLVFSLQISGKWQAGDYAGAQDASKVAKIMGIIGLVAFVLGVLYVVAVLGIMAIGIIGAANAPDPGYTTY